MTREDPKMSQSEAVVVRNASKAYDKNKPILNDLNMSVTRGTIYGLLGASGCGKTTLLSCIVGIRSLDSGEMWVLGGQPGTKASSIPGPRVGYMPQEISLVQEFTAMGALFYFGRINGLEDRVIEERYNLLSKMLQLPPRNRLVKSMSGGQQRRVSLACALVHEPELLILDEPTVGLDPVLREDIWSFLIDLTRQRGVTIIITTHYIDETKLANKIGLLRHGKLLAEASPLQLLSKCHCDTLEEAFLRLSQKQKETEDTNKRCSPETNAELMPELQEINSGFCESNYDLSNDRSNLQASWDEKPVSQTIKHRRYRRFQALMIKNFLQFVRHPGGIVFALIFPLLQVNIFFNSIGGDPRGMKIAVINSEAGNCQNGTYFGHVLNSTSVRDCTFVDLSCRFLGSFQQHVISEFYDDFESATRAVKHGKAVGTVYFAKNFSKALEDRLDYIISDDSGSGEITVQLDMGNREIGLFMQKILYERFIKTYGEITQECALPKKFGEIPLHFQEPIFGTMDEKYSTFIAPALLLTLTFFLATAVSSSIIIADRHEGVWHRSLVQGVTTPEILTSHILTQVIVIVIQVTVTTGVAFAQYKLECRGSLTVVILLVFLNGLCGMCYGFLVSVLCSSHTMANFITTGSFYPVILLCGCMWPIEGMPKILQWLSLVLPTTIPGLALRSLLNKGYSFVEAEVYNGFLVIAGWIVVFIALCLVGLRKKKS